MSRKKRRDSDTPGAESNPAVGNGRRDRWERVHLAGICILLAFATLLVFRQTGQFDFVNFDDDRNVYENPHVTQGLSLEGVQWAFSHSQLGHWAPLTTLSHMLACQVFGLNAGGHHLTNALLHATSAILLFLTLRQMTGAFWRSAFVAALFAIHPQRVESVAWVTERKDVLSGLFFMLTIGAYHRYARNPWSLARYFLVVLLFALGLLAKSMLVTLPLLLLLLDYWPLRRFMQPEGKNSADTQPDSPGPTATPWGPILEKIPLLALSAAISAVTVLSGETSIVSTEKLPLGNRLNNALVSYGAYVWQMFIPTNLAAFYPFPLSGFHPLKIIGAAVFLIGLCTAAVALRRNRPWFLVGWFWYLGMLVPVIGIVQSGAIARADRYTYLPHIGLYLIVAWGVAELGKRWRFPRWVPGSAAALVMAGLINISYNQTTVWRDSESLWRHTLSRSPDAAVAHVGLAAALAQQHRNQEAITHLRQALALFPNYPLALGNLANGLLEEGRPDEAIIHYRQLLRLEPHSAETHTRLATALKELGRPGEALAHYQQALLIDSSSVETHSALAWMLATSPDATIRNGQKALEHARLADRLSGNADPNVIDTLAAAFAEAGRFPEAIQTARRALQAALAQGDQGLADDIRSRLQLYQQHRAFRETVAPTNAANQPG